MHELVDNDRVIGGIDEASTEKAMLFIKSLLKVTCIEPMHVLLKCVN